MTAKKCGFMAGHKWARKTSRVRPGVFQQRCIRCGRIRNVQCGTFLRSHRWHRDRRTKKGTLTCRRCGEKRTA